MKLLLFNLFLIFGCSSRQYLADSEVLKFKGTFFKEDNQEYIGVYYLNIPKGGVLDKKIHTGDYHSEFRVNYPDSSIIYITNNEVRGSVLNFENRVRQGFDVYRKEHLLDTISVSAQLLNGDYWRETILGQVVVGYINVPSNKTERYDKSISTIRIKR